MNLRKKIEDVVADRNPDAIFLDGYDDAIVGIVSRPNLCVVAYDPKKCIECLMKQNDMSYDDALEWFEFNVECAYMGEHTPVFISITSHEDFPN